MELCREYAETSLKNNKKFIQISGDYKCAHIQLFLNIGANCDPDNKKGLSHLCEHIFLHTIIREYGEKKADKDFNCMGYTDYDYTVFKFIVSNTNEHIECLLKILSENINSIVVNEESIKICKEEIINEFTYRKEDVKRSLKINNFITENKINYVPLGKIEDICKLSIEDIKLYYGKYAANVNLVIFDDPSIKKFNSEDFKIENYELENKKANKEIKYTGNKILAIDTQQGQQLKVYFKHDNKVFSKKENVAIYILEIIMEYHICSLLNIKENECSPVSFRKKIIDNNYAFLILCINKYKEKRKGNIKMLVDNILNISITNLDFEKGKDIFCELIDQIDDVDEGYASNNVFHYLINNELIAVTKEQLDSLRYLVRCTSLEEINNVKEKIYNNNYKAVTSNFSSSNIK